MSTELEEVIRCDVCRRSFEESVEYMYGPAGHNLGCKHDICDRCMHKIWGAAKGAEGARKCPACEKEKAS